MTDAFLTRAELSNFQETSRYAEAIDYCRKLEAASPWIRFTSFGKSPLGRDLPLLIVSCDQAFTPQEASARRLPVVLVINGIHPGEIAGKEASFMLLRDLAVRKQKAGLLEHVILLVVPIYSVDGHERMSPYNRINQNGPREMGWRGTSQNLNLNRDWMKADQPEGQAMLQLYGAWLPHMAIDNHVSDGADYQYDLTYIIDDHPGVAPVLRSYFEKEFEPGFVQKLTASGHIVSRYFEPRDLTDPEAGIVSGPLTPRFSNGYGTLQNRPTLVIETHMLKTFETRIRSHYDLMEATLEALQQKGQALIQAVEQADRESMELGRTFNPDARFPLSFKLNEQKSDPFLFHGVEFTRELSAISGGMMVTFGSKPRDFTVPHFGYFDTIAETAPPLGYIIPPQWTAIIERLKIHSIAFSVVPRELTGEFETYRFRNASWQQVPFEGHHMLTYETALVVEQRTLPAGSIAVRLNQRCNKVILGLLEPDAPDSLVRWGFLDPIFEEKEYAEGYIIEPLARQMMAADPALKAEFERRIQTDPKFAGDPAARLNFFYQRSPYRDGEKDAYPIVRVTRQEQASSLGWHA